MSRKTTYHSCDNLRDYIDAHEAFARLLARLPADRTTLVNEYAVRLDETELDALGANELWHDWPHGDARWLDEWNTLLAAEGLRGHWDAGTVYTVEAR